MQEHIPYKKLLRVALITAPLFGLFGATPVIIFNKIDLARIPFAFVVTTLVTSFLWALNIYFLWLAQRSNFFKTDWKRYAVSFGICGLLIFLIVDVWLRPLLPPMPPPDMHMPIQPDALAHRRWGLHFIQPQSINIIIMIIIEMILLRDKKAQIEKENYQLKMSNLEAKHNLLKQQLHPHFLFNSLNTLKSLINRSPEQAEEYLIKLSDLLRFSTATNNRTLIPLKEELELCTNYLNMQKVRFGDALNFNIDVPSSLQSQTSVPVYSVQLLAENAIKHNIVTVQQPLHISIKGDNNKRTMTVNNNMQLKHNMNEKSGVGLANLTERYRLLGSEALQVEENSKTFTVTIKTLEHESCNS